MYTHSKGKRIYKKKQRDIDSLLGTLDRTEHEAEIQSHKAVRAPVTQGWQKPRSTLNMTDAFNSHWSRDMTFKDVMAVWENNSGTRDSLDFLNSIGLLEYVDPRDYAALLSGEKAPGQALTEFLASRVPLDICGAAKFRYLGIQARNGTADTLSVRFAVDGSPRPYAYEKISAYDQGEYAFYPAYKDRLLWFRQKVGENHDEAYSVSKKAKYAGIHVWALMGFLPLPAHITPQEAAKRIMRTIMPEGDQNRKYQDFFRLAIQHFESRNRIDLQGALNSPVQKSTKNIIRTVATIQNAPFAYNLLEELSQSPENIEILTQCLDLLKIKDQDVRAMLLAQYQQDIGLTADVRARQLNASPQAPQTLAIT